MTRTRCADDLRRSFVRDIGVACRSARADRGVSQREVARRLGWSHSRLSRIELGTGNPSLGAVASLACLLGIQVEWATRQPLVEVRQVDAVHSRLVAHAQRRLEAAGWTVRREVEIRFAGRTGWIDLVAYRPDTRVVVVIEVKSELRDLGALERQTRSYLAAANAVTNRLGWHPRHVVGWLLVAATEANDRRLVENRRALAQSFPGRAGGMAALAAGGSAAGHEWNLAMIDPGSRRRNWLIATRLDGRRSRHRLAGYAAMAEDGRPRRDARSRHAA